MTKTNIVLIALTIATAIASVTISVINDNPTTVSNISTYNID